MNCFVVIAHPATDCLCRTVAAQAVKDLYDGGFEPALTKEERAS